MSALPPPLTPTPTPTHLDLLRCPLVQVDRLDPGDVDSQVAVDAGAADAHEDAEIP